jgi:outer membrane protein assembly factor BamB
MLEIMKVFGETKSVKVSRNSRLKTFALAFCLLMFASAFLVLSSFTATASAAVGSSIPSSLLQYEFPVKGQRGANDMAQTYFIGGPAPSAFNVAWKVPIPGTAFLFKGSYGDNVLSAFNGYVFVNVPATTGDGGTYKGRLFAYDGGTGALLWSTTEGTTGTASKIDGTYMMMGNNLVKCADGSTVWKAPAGFAQGGSYIPELKMFIDPAIAWSLPDPTQPPTVVWNITGNVNAGSVGTWVYGDGKIIHFMRDYTMCALDVQTGKTLWTGYHSSEATYGATYAAGKVFWGGLDNNLRCWDANTGKLLWTYNPHGFYGQWASASGYAYGMVYEHNQDNYMYAINATTGQLVWRQSGPGIWYSNKFTIADGKVYVQMGEREYRDFATGEFAKSEFDCYDAYTGKLIWTSPVEVGAGPSMQQINAYGNLYLSPTMSYSLPGVYAGSRNIGELWCISSTTQDWAQFLNNPTHTAMGSGPDNLALKWKFTTGAAVIGSPSLANGVCYFGSTDKNIYAVNAATGASIWSFQTGFNQWSTPAVANGKVFTGADDGNIYGIDAATGKQIWKTFAGGQTVNQLGIGYTAQRSSPVVLNGRVYVGALDGNLYCLDGNNGNIIWKFIGVAPCVILASPTIYDNAIYLPSTRGGYPVGQGPAVTNGDFYKLDMNGNVIWHKDIAYPLNLTANRGNWLFATPTVAPDLGLVFLRNAYRFTYAINMNTGDIVWTYKGFANPGTPSQAGAQPQTDAPCYAYGIVYVGDFYDVTALNATNGNTIWNLYLSREVNHCGITYSYDRLYCATEAGAVYVLDAETGAKISYYELGGGAALSIHSTAVPYKGDLYIGTTDWNMYCFGDARVMSASAAQAHPSVAAASSANLPLGELAPAIVPAAQTPATTTSSTTVTYVTAAAVIAIAAATATIILKKRK